MPDNQALGYFLSGLRSNIRKQIGIHEPKTTMRAMDLAQSIEESLVGEPIDPYTTYSNMGPRSKQSMGQHMGWTQRGGTWNGGQGAMSGVQGRRTAKWDSSLTMAKSAPGIEKQGSNTWGSQGREGRIVSHQEYVRRREKGLCFKCGEPYSPQHRCAAKIMRVTVLAEDEVGEAGSEFDHEDRDKNEPGEEPVVEYGTLGCRMYFVGGVNQSRTMKFRAGIGGVDVVTLVDSGASHNFVSKKTN